MKQLTSILLACMYLLLSLGVQVNRHYCGGELTSVGFYVGKGSCPCGDTEMLSSCCEDVNTSFQLDDEQQKTDFAVQLNKVEIPKFVPQIPDFEVFAFQNYSSFFDSLAVFWYSPPDSTPKIPLYLRNRVLRV